MTTQNATRYLGAEGRLYTMRLEARGIYVMREWATVYVPRSQHDFSVLSSTVNIFRNVHARLQDTIANISKKRPKVVNLTRPGFGTPIRVCRT